MFVWFFFFKQKTAYEMLRSLVGSEMCIRDSYYAVFDGGAVDGAEFLLTSALKRVDNAVYDTIADQIAGNFSSGSIMYDLSDEGVGLAPYHEAEASIPQDVQDHVTAVMQGILNGEIDVWEPWTYRMFLPAVVK